MDNVLTHELFLDNEVYYVAQYEKVTEEGLSDIISCNEANGVENCKGGCYVGGRENHEQDVQVEVPVICFHQNIQDDDPYLTSTDHTGFIYVDNDNETVSENTPNPGLSVDDFRYNDE